MNPQSIKILMIEDNADYTSAVRTRLTDHHTREFTLDHADSLAAGIKKLAGGSYDIILLDLNLPDGDGMDMVKTVKKNALSVPIVVLTSVNEKSTALEAIRNGAQDYLIKGHHDREYFEQYLRFAVERHRKLADIRQSAQNAEADAAAFLQVVARNADGIMIVDRNGVVRFANPAVKAVFGRDEAEFIGKPFGFPVVDGQTSELEIARGPRAEKAVVEMRVAATEWKNETAYIASLRDITNLKTTARNLMVANARLKELQEIDRMKSTFVSNVSHELRTPLTVILSTVNNLLDGILGELTEDQHKWIKKVQNHAQRLHELVSDILDLSKLESGKIELKPEPVELEPLIAALVSNFQPMVEERKLRLEKEIAGTLPKIWGSKGRLDQVITNLITNAMKFTPAGGAIKVRALHEKDYVQISVRDSGIGIAPENREAIFERFKQVDGADPSPTRGIGLGLAICAEIVNQHRGRIWVESETGKGSEFIFRIPVDFRLRGVARPGIILVIDDDKPMCDLIARVLEGSRHQVKLIHDGQEALDYVSNPNKLFDLVLLDLMIPGVSGVKILDALRDQKRGSKTIILTAYPQSDIGRDLTRDGEIIISKPFNLNDIRRAVERFLPAANSAV